jgi:hypothetical protein
MKKWWRARHFQTCSNYDVDQNWQQSSYLPLYRKQWNLWWLIVKIWSRTTIWTLNFLELMEPLFEEICDETSEYARVQLNNPNRNWKMMKNGLTQHIPSTEKKTNWQKGVLCARAGANGVKVFGSANSVWLPFIKKNIFRSTTLNNHFRTPVLASLNFQYYTCNIPGKNLYYLIFYYFLDVTMPHTEILGDLNLIT